MTIKKSHVLALSLAFSALSVSTAAAEELKGTVHEVFVKADGTLIADFAGDTLGNLYLCSVGATVRNVAPAVCSEIFQLLIAAKLSGIPVAIVGTKVVIASTTNQTVTVDYVKFAN